MCVLITMSIDLVDVVPGLIQVFSVWWLVGWHSVRVFSDTQRKSKWQKTMPCWWRTNGRWNRTLNTNKFLVLIPELCLPRPPPQIRSGRWLQTRWWVSGNDNEDLSTPCAWYFIGNSETRTHTTPVLLFEIKLIFNLRWFIKSIPRLE